MDNLGSRPERHNNSTAERILISCDAGEPLMPRAAAAQTYAKRVTLREKVDEKVDERFGENA